MMNSFPSTWTIPQLEMSAWIRCTFIAWVLPKLPMVPYQSLTLSKMAKAKKLGRVAVSWIVHLIITQNNMSQQFFLSVERIMPLFLQAWDLIEKKQASELNEKMIGYIYKTLSGEYILNCVCGMVWYVCSGSSIRSTSMWSGGWDGVAAPDRPFVWRACDPVDGVICL